ncbi:FAD/NAD(P)-binding domain-containing protein [Schizopora paradoxa]|uniref:FAD/NAD(P)-binding domain-containing protein n=1 Tax=Schizopora paradoxa TaxID=27342 RepID=A0A0H2SBI6_9AGAM|nr:FAD/NAD(P)-binding domain-containing protein [Schizopora paradoxa]
MSMRVGIIGAGAAGLITAKTLLEDGFQVQILTRDSSVGGVWARQRIYPSLHLNNVYGEFRFSSLPMPAPKDAGDGGRLNGGIMRDYFESFAARFLKECIQFEVEVINIHRNASGKWEVSLRDMKTSGEETIVFDKIVLCTGGCSSPHIPESLSPSAARQAGFKGDVFHTSDFLSHMEKLDAPDKSNEEIVVVGGGKSAQDFIGYAVGKGHNVTMIFTKADSFLAAPFTLPGFIRKSRFLAVLSPHIRLETRLEKFMHKTSIGSTLTHAFWNFLTWSSFDTFKIPPSSPFRNSFSNFWEIRTNDEGSRSLSGFFDYLKQGKINVIAPARASRFAEDGSGLILEDGSKVKAGTVVLATGYKSSWDNLFDEETRQSLGLSRQPVASQPETWDYVTLANPPVVRSAEEPKAAASIYRGIVPAQNLLRKDFAINGSIFTVNNGYTFEVVSHWISSYFLEDRFLQLPSSVEDALVETQINAAWLRKRFPGTFSWVNESYSSNVAFFK